MGTQVKATFAYKTKPQYLAQVLDGNALDITDGEFGIWIGNAVSSRMEAYNSILQCMQKLRSLGWANPPSTTFNNARMVAGSGQSATLFSLGAALPTLAEDEVAVIQASDFTENHDSNTGHTRRCLESWRELPEAGAGALALGELLFQAFVDVDGTFDPDVVIGTGPVSEGRTGAILTPADTGLYVSQPDTAPAEYFHDGDNWIYIGPEITNVGLFTSEFEDVYWSPFNAFTMLQDQPGFTGGANEGWTFFSESSSSFIQSGFFPVASVGNVTVRAFFVKDGNDGDRYSSILLTRLAPPSANCAVNVNTATGEAGFSLNAENGGEFLVIDHGDYWEVLVSNDMGTVDGTSVACYPGNATSIGGGGDPGPAAVGVLAIEAYNDLTIEQVAGSPPLAASAAPTVSPATGINFLIANHNNSDGAYTAETFLFADQAQSLAGNDVGVIQVSANADGNIMLLNTGVIVNEAQLSAEDVSGPAESGLFGYVRGRYLPVSAYQAGESVQAVSGQILGVPPTQGTYTGFNTPAQIDIGPPHAGGSTVPLLIRDIRRYSVVSS